MGIRAGLANRLHHLMLTLHEGKRPPLRRESQGGTRSVSEHALMLAPANDKTPPTSSRGRETGSALPVWWRHLSGYIDPWVSVRFRCRWLWCYWWGLRCGSCGDGTGEANQRGRPRCEPEALAGADGPRHGSYRRMRSALRPAQPIEPFDGCWTPIAVGRVCKPYRQPISILAVRAPNQPEPLMERVDTRRYRPE